MISHPGGVPGGRLGVGVDGPADSQSRPGRHVRPAAVRAISCSISWRNWSSSVRSCQAGISVRRIISSESGRRIGADERAAAAAPPGPYVAGRLQPLNGLPHGRPAHFQHGGELPLGRQPLAGDELAERDRGHETLGDALARTAHGNRRQQRAEGLMPVAGTVIVRLSAGKYRVTRRPAVAADRHPAGPRPAENTAMGHARTCCASDPSPGVPHHAQERELAGDARGKRSRDRYLDHFCELRVVCQ